MRARHFTNALAHTLVLALLALPALGTAARTPLYPHQFHLVQRCTQVPGNPMPPRANWLQTPRSMPSKPKAIGR